MEERIYSISGNRYSISGCEAPFANSSFSEFQSTLPVTGFTSSGGFECGPDRCSCAGGGERSGRRLLRRSLGNMAAASSGRAAESIFSSSLGYSTFARIPWAQYSVAVYTLSSSLPFRGRNAMWRSQCLIA